MTARILEGECERWLAQLPSNSVDSLVTDPPAGISFMGQDWDGSKGGRDHWIAWLTGVMAECLRVLKPGGHGLVWALPRTSHWTATALEDAGFEIRDVVTHHFGTGFPKSLDVSKAIDKAAGAEHEVVGVKVDAKTGKPVSAKQMRRGSGIGLHEGYERPCLQNEASCEAGASVTAPATDAAKQWAGWGTALKPASEHWILVRKPFDTTVAENVQEHGTGAINIDVCRINPGQVVRGGGNGQGHNGGKFGAGETNGVRAIVEPHSLGRWPANVVFTHLVECVDGTCVEGCPVRELDAQSGTLKSGAWNGARNTPKTKHSFGAFAGTTERPRESSEGGASRFFYCAKPSTSEKEAGLAPGDAKRGNTHPTVKSIALMSYLVKLITPPGGVVLDPFAGSGTTGAACVGGGFSFVGIEKDPTFARIARERIAYWQAKAKPVVQLTIASALG